MCNKPLFIFPITTLKDPIKLAQNGINPAIAPRQTYQDQDRFGFKAIQAICKALTQVYKFPSDLYLLLSHLCIRRNVVMTFLYLVSVPVTAAVCILRRTMSKG